MIFFRGWIVLTFLGLVVASAMSAEEPGKESRARMRRVIYNLDGDSCMTLKRGSKRAEEVTAKDLRTLVGELTYPGSQVDTILVCINAQVMYYPTKVGTMRGARSTAEEREKWPAGEKQRLKNMQGFFERGEDPYALILAEAKKTGREALLTFRMNDAHGNDFLRTKFWEDHPDYRLPRAGGLDFARVEVREHILALIEEALRRYDCDGIELDFQRFPTFFKEGTPEEQRLAATNDLVQRVDGLRRKLEGEKKRKLVIGARIPSDYGRTPPSYASAKKIGCDPVAWAKDGWVDFLTVSEFLFERYDLPIKPWKELIPEVPIYGSIETAEGGKIEQCLTAEKYRKAAAHLWRDGADGIYLFNFFTTREWREKGFEPPFEVLSELGSANVKP